MPASTRDDMLETARKLFAERGFDGVSIAAIAEAHGLTKQALLHHFSTKEKLYGEMLAGISGELDAVMDAAIAGSDDAAMRIKAILIALIPKTEADTIRTRLLMRELLDNRERAATAKDWRLAPFLKTMMTLVRDVPGWRGAGGGEALAVVYQLIGAVSYYAVSTPTLRGIFGAAGMKELKKAFAPQLETLIDAALARPPKR